MDRKDIKKEKKNSFLTISFFDISVVCTCRDMNKVCIVAGRNTTRQKKKMDILKNKKSKKNIYFAKTLKKEICQIYERVRTSNLIKKYTKISLDQYQFNSLDGIYIVENYLKSYEI